ncbi:MAG: catalase [Candidatus Obscuribacterales bacterium]|nr:catalase [Steroidobacteraceae bacterium]
MATRKSLRSSARSATKSVDGNKISSASNRPRKSPQATVSGPARKAGNNAVKATDLLAFKAAGTAKLAAAMPFNTNKPAEYTRDGALNPPAGEHATPIEPSITGSTLTEKTASAKTGASPAIGENRMNQPLDRVRVDSQAHVLTTNQGVPVANNQLSLKAGVRGPTLLEDFILREKITHFDHERIPERVVHARGSAAHGFFECYDSLQKLTRASLFAEKGKRTPVFVRFSTVAGERGSADTVRDARGFAVKFYTDEGNWDLVGNNIPVFFIQDAMKFPDLVHALKPEPHSAMPQASSAHDTFWDFVSLMPESTHMLLWVMSDRGVPRSYRMMQGFGVHTFRFINAQGAAVFVKFHWNPLAGTHSLDWDEAVKINGADPDFHRRDLWEAIETGAYPEYELGVQIFSEAEAERFSFDVLDATKLVPEELVPVTPIGRMVLNRNPDNFFAETEQVAFCAAHIIPGLDFSNDPLLAGRIHSYQDTQLSRLGGPNFHEIPINASVNQVHNNTRDGLHRQAIHRGRVSYEPNSLGGGCPFQAGKQGFMSFPQPVKDDKVRGSPERFAEHYNQATLFWNSQSDVEKAHIVRAFRFELTKVETGAIRERVVAMLANVADELARGVADGIGIKVPKPLPIVIAKVPRPEIKISKALSLLARPGDGSIRTRRIAILVADGMKSDVAALHSALSLAGAVPRYVGIRLGQIRAADGKKLTVNVTLEAMPAVLFDALVLPDGQQAVATLLNHGHVIEFVKEQYRHCKPILALGTSASLLDQCGIPRTLPSGEADSGLLLFSSPSAEASAAFCSAVAKHRHLARYADPPVI